MLERQVACSARLNNENRKALYSDDLYVEPSVCSLDLERICSYTTLFFKQRKNISYVGVHIVPFTTLPRTSLRGHALQEQIVKIYAPIKSFHGFAFILSMCANVISVIGHARHSIGRHPRSIGVDAVGSARAHAGQDGNSRPHGGGSFLERIEYFFPRRRRHVAVAI